MADSILHQIKAYYGEILGLANHLPDNLISPSIVNIYNNTVDELSSISNADYARFKVTDEDSYSLDFDADIVKPKMGAILSRLEHEYGFVKPERGMPPSTNIITIQNSNRLDVTIVPIQSIIDNIGNDDLRADVEELKQVIESTRDKQRASSLLNVIQQKSWDVFLALLPIVFQQLGQSSNSQ